MKGVSAVLHTATLHKPHVATHSMQDFVDTNITGTLKLLEAAIAEGVGSFIFTSTTSTFGEAMRPPPGSPAALVTEDLAPVPRNIYGVTKLAAENICRLFHKLHGLPCLILRTSRFFPEEDDKGAIRNAYEDMNAKLNELTYRRVDIADVVSAHLCALDRAREIGFGRYIISATTPFEAGDMEELGRDAPAVLKRYADYEEEYSRRGWRMFDTLDRVYVNDPEFDFLTALNRIKRNESPFSPLRDMIGKKGYHDEIFEDGPFPVNE
jgi:UDP-glucose 4-epimerase